MTKIGPINVASAEFLRQLDAIEPGVWGTPCAVFLIDGRAIDPCLCWENPRFSDARHWINPENVAHLRESPSRMPARFARMIRDAGESGMGYHLYTVELCDGASFVYATGNLAIDLLDLPEGYTQRDVVAVRPHEGREKLNTDAHRPEAAFHSVEYGRTGATP